MDTSLQGDPSWPSGVMEQLRLISGALATSLSHTAATLIPLGAEPRQGVVLHNPIWGTQVALTLVSADASAPSTVAAANQLFVVGGGASLTLSLGPGVAIYAQSDVSGGQLNAARIGD